MQIWYLDHMLNFRWDERCIDKLPEYMKICYLSLLDLFNEYEEDLAKEGRSSCVHVAQEEMIVYCQSYMQEASWLNSKYIPTYDDYVRNGIVSFGTTVGLIKIYLGMGPVATEEACRWARKLPTAVRAAGLIFRLLDDVAGYKAKMPSLPLVKE
ncbi:hypothetical protein Ancab_026150 [Ancistrocladus abbreviatus]